MRHASRSAAGSDNDYFNCSDSAESDVQTTTKGTFEPNWLSAARRARSSTDGRATGPRSVSSGRSRLPRKKFTAAAVVVPSSFYDVRSVIGRPCTSAQAVESLQAGGRVSLEAALSTVRAVTRMAGCVSQSHEAPSEQFPSTRSPTTPSYPAPQSTSSAAPAIVSQKSVVRKESRKGPQKKLQPTRSIGSQAPRSRSQKVPTVSTAADVIAEPPDEDPRSLSWSASEIQSLLDASSKIATTDPRYWDMVASVVSPNGERSAEDCAKKLMDIQEER